MESLLSIETISGLLVFFSLPWVLAALASTFLDASVGYIDEWLLRTVGKNGTRETVSIDAPGQLILISGFFGVIISILVASIALTTEQSLSINNTGFLLAVAAGILEVLWLVPYFYAIERAGALNATPILQTIPIFSLVLGIAFFAEIPTVLHVLGALCIIGGAFLLNYSPDLGKLDYITIGLMLLVSEIISLGLFFFKDGYEATNFLTALFGNGIGMGLMSICLWSLIPAYRKQFWQCVTSFSTKILLLQTGNEALYSAASVLNQLAIILGPTVMVVAAMNSFHPVFTLVIGAVLVKLGLSDRGDDFIGKNKYLKISAIGIIAVGAMVIGQ